MYNFVATSLRKKCAEKFYGNWTLRRLNIVLSCGSLHIAETACSSLLNASTIYRSSFQVLSAASVVVLSSASAATPSFSTQMSSILLPALLKITFCFKSGLGMTTSCSLYSYSYSYMQLYHAFHFLILFLIHTLLYYVH